MTIKVLVVDDQYHNIRLLEQILEEISEDIQIINADTGEKAISVAKEIEFDLVLMDISLPDMDGMQITKELKIFPQYRNTPFIAVTANATLKDEEIFKRIFDDYVFKPIDEEVFTEKIKKWIGVM